MRGLKDAFKMHPCPLGYNNRIMLLRIFHRMDSQKENSVFIRNQSGMYNGLQ